MDLHSSEELSSKIQRLLTFTIKNIDQIKLSGTKTLQADNAFHACLSCTEMDVDSVNMQHTFWENE